MVMYVGKDFVLENTGVWGSIDRQKHSFFSNLPESVSIYDVLDGDMPMEYKSWYLVNFGYLSVEDRKEMAKNGLRLMLDKYTRQFWEDPSIRNLIEQAIICIDDDSQENLDKLNQLNNICHADGAHASITRSMRVGGQFRDNSVCIGHIGIFTKSYIGDDFLPIMRKCVEKAHKRK